MTKRWWTAALAGVIVLSMAGCQTGIRSLAIKDPEEDRLFRDDERVVQVLEEFRQADPFIQMKNTDKLEKKTLETDDESATAVYGYFDKDRLVYKDYEGYGEDTFAYFPDGENGGVLRCQDEDGKRYAAWYQVEDEKGTVRVSTASDMDRRYAYGAEELEVVLEPADGDRIWTCYRINTVKKTAYLSYARYRDADGDWYDYCGEVGEGEKPFSEARYLHLTGEHPANIAGDTGLPAELAKKADVQIQLMLGSGHRFYWAEGPDGTLQWYLEAPVTLVFPDKSARDAFWRQHPAGTAETLTDNAGEKELFAWNQTSILLLSDLDAPASADDFLDSEFNDPVYYAVTLHEDGSIATLKVGSLLSAC